jgi:uncharacterized protein (DUF924 family)
MSATLPQEGLSTWQDLLEFWFDGGHVPLWFKTDAAFDARIRERFTPLIEAALGGALAEWESAPDSCLALLIVLDQLPRNAWRGTPRAFCGDVAARAVADRALACGFDSRMPLQRRQFFYLPLEHSETLADQQRCCVFVARMAEEAGEADREWTKKQVRYAERHREIIERFGRFPHRNAIFARPSTPEEAAFLMDPMSSF